MEPKKIERKRSKKEGLVGRISEIEPLSQRQEEFPRKKKQKKRLPRTRFLFFFVLPTRHGLATAARATQRRAAPIVRHIAKLQPPPLFRLLLRCVHTKRNKI